MLKEQKEPNWITLTDEEGQEHRFNLLNVVEMEGNKYVLMVPEIQEEDQEEEAVIFKVEIDEEGEEILVDIEDDDEFAKVCTFLDELEENENDDEEEED